LADELAATRAAMSRLSRMWMHVLAYLRLSKAAVCLMSTDARDYHDWPDGHIGQPAHFAAHRCTRCGKVFTI
jgi:hypothetical protein